MSFESEYRDLVIKQYWDKPKARAEIELLAKSYGRTFEWLESFLAEFDVDLATGERLDIIGRLVGVNRSVPFVIEKIAFGFADKAQRRYFIDFNGTDASMELVDPFQPAGDFELEIDFSTTETSGFPTLIATSNPGFDGIRIFFDSSAGTNFLRTAISSTLAYLSFGGVSNDGKLHTVKLRRVNDDFYISMDGGAEATTNQPVTIADFTEIGNNFDGVIANVKLTDLDTPTNSLAFALDQATGTTESSSINSGTLTYVNISESSRFEAEILDADWVGTTELVTNYDFSNGLTDWIVIDGGGSQTVEVVNSQLHIVSDGTLAQVYQEIIDIGGTYRAVVVAGSITGDELIISSGLTFTLVQNTKNTWDFVGGGSFALKRFSGAVEGYVDSASVKRILGAP
jgi:hypothetical protein